MGENTLWRLRSRRHIAAPPLAPPPRAPSPRPEAMRPGSGDHIPIPKIAARTASARGAKRVISPAASTMTSLSPSGKTAIQ